MQEVYLETLRLGLEAATRGGEEEMFAVSAVRPHCGNTNQQDKHISDKLHKHNKSQSVKVEKAAKHKSSLGEHEGMEHVRD